MTTDCIWFFVQTTAPALATPSGQAGAPDFLNGASGIQQGAVKPETQEGRKMEAERWKMDMDWRANVISGKQDDGALGTARSASTCGNCFSNCSRNLILSFCLHFSASFFWLRLQPRCLE
jgi:hypothetical protein